MHKGGERRENNTHRGAGIVLAAAVSEGDKAKIPLKFP